MSTPRILPADELEKQRTGEMHTEGGQTMPSRFLLPVLFIWPRELYLLFEWILNVVLKNKFALLQFDKEKKLL